MINLHRLILFLSCSILIIELSVVAYYHTELFNWFSQNLWVVIIPFIQILIKRLVALKLIVFLKVIVILFWNLSKLFLLKLFKTLMVRYGVFFSQHKWVWIRRIKIMFLRRGKQFFRSVSRFWNQYKLRDKWIILIAFFPVGLLLFFLGLSFNITRKTMVKKTQESAIFQAATSASKSSRGVKAWIARLDKTTLQKIRALTPRNRQIDVDADETKNV